MSDYRHVTNMQTPFDSLDLKFLGILKDYRLGDPVKADPVPDAPPPREVPGLKSLAIVGLYSTWDAVGAKDVKSVHGWNITLDQWNKLPLWPMSNHLG